MSKLCRANNILSSLGLCVALIGGTKADACTSLTYTDAKGAVYYGRTLELALELPYLVTYFPAGETFSSKVAANTAPLNYRSRYRILAVTVPDSSPTDLKIVEGFNEAGLTYSLLAFADASGPTASFEKTKAAIAAIDLGTWTLGQFGSVEEVKTALAEQTAILTPLAAMGNEPSSFHFTVHDRTGASIVIEFTDGKQYVHDNPVGVMTNGPALPWHLTNLANYSFLSNIDKSSTTFGTLSVSQPDSGIATEGLPASNTSVGRFVRAAYYSKFAEKVDTPDAAVQTLAHIMNNFDRPKNISIDPGASGDGEGGGGSTTATAKAAAGFTSEYTSWTALTDLDREKLFLRPYQGMNYTEFDLAKLGDLKSVVSIPLKGLDGMAGDATTALIAAEQ